jgi:peptidyl-prolyl cis-trans isomerase C
MPPAADRVSKTALPPEAASGYKPRCQDSESFAIVWAEQEVRMKGRTWTVGGLASTLVLACAVGRVPAQPAAAAGDKPVAVVNGEVITHAELEAALKQAGPTAAPQPEAQKRQQQQLALNLLIDQALMRQFLKQNAAPADPAEINKKMAEMAEGLKKQGKSLAEFCRDMNLTEAQVRANVAMMIQWLAFARQHVSDQDLEKYYQEYKDLFDKVTVHASHIFLRLPQGASEGDKAQARAKLVELKARLDAKQIEFGKAAKEFSQCPTAEKDGDIGWFGRKWMVEENIAKAAFALQPGQVSDVIETEYGLHLVKVLERKPGQPSDFAKIKDEVRDFYIEDMQQTVLMQARKTAQVKIDLP